MCQPVKQILNFDSFKASHYQNDKEGMIILYRKNSNGEFHRVIKIKKQELIELALLIKEHIDEI